jgi:hypothetical protein
MKQSYKRAFIISTTDEMKRFGDTIRETLSNFGVEAVLLRSLGEEPKYPFEKVRKELEKASLVVLVLGHRYGMVDKHKSWTDYELELARHLKKPVLAFLAREDAPWPVSEIDSDRSRINHFRLHIESNYLVSYFSSSSDLAARLTSAVDDLLRTLSANKTGKKQKNEQASIIKKVRIVRLLLSSPGDVSAEREAYQNAVYRFNQSAVKNQGLFINVIRWEEMAPQIGPGAQNIINSQIGSFELFSGIMWNRFGTPTDVAASGTEEEFTGALDLWRKNRKPWITFYFCDRPTSFANQEQLEQKSRVLKFKEKLNNLGIVRHFEEVGELENIGFKDLVNISNTRSFKELLKNNIASNSAST